ncbi:hypothetical protein M8494_29305 [Serratia ureilytica]
MEEEEGLPLIGPRRRRRAAAGAAAHRRALPWILPCLNRAPISCCGWNGMSMRDIGILDGDLLAVHKTQDVRNGGRGGAHRRRSDGQAPEKHGNVVELLPENNEFQPIVVDPASAELPSKGWRSA